MLSESPGYRSRAGLMSTQANNDRRSSTQHVVRYDSAHASTWPEYAPARRTVDRSTVRCTSPSRPLSASAVQERASSVERQRRPVVNRGTIHRGTTHHAHCHLSITVVLRLMVSHMVERRRH